MNYKCPRGNSEALYCFNRIWHEFALNFLQNIFIYCVVKLLTLRSNSLNSTIERARRSSLVLLSLAGAMCITGCGEDLGFEVAPVTGTVTQGGASMVNAYVEFWPVNGNRPSLARTDSNGLYELEYSRTVKGAAVGLHSVKIGTGGELDTSDPESRRDIPMKEYLATEAEVKANTKNRLDFEVPVEAPKKKSK